MSLQYIAGSTQTNKQLLFLGSRNYGSSASSVIPHSCLTQSVLLGTFQRSDTSIKLTLTPTTITGLRNMTYAKCSNPNTQAEAFGTWEGTVTVTHSTMKLTRTDSSCAVTAMLSNNLALFEKHATKPPPPPTTASYGSSYTYSYTNPMTEYLYEQNPSSYSYFKNEYNSYEPTTESYETDEAYSYSYESYKYSDGSYS